MSAPAGRPLGLFAATGVEIECMIVDAETLDVRPIADELFRLEAGDPAADVAPLGADPRVSWSNELVRHVVEFKTAGPAPTLDGLGDAFHAHVRRANEGLRTLGARLLPGGAHPWMDPARETSLWPHECTEVYHAFDRIFSCRGHGWANLQSLHLNLPFADDAEFGRLHAAIRAILPILPALAASSPFLDGRFAGALDARLEAYRGNARRVPRVAGLVVPEPIFSIADYHAHVLEPLYRDIAPLDPEGVLQHEWLNARGAIARFARSAIEIRVIDAQECPAADLAVARLVTAVVRGLVEERLAPATAQRDAPTEALHAVLLRCIRDGDEAVVDDSACLAALGLSGAQRAGEAWRTLRERALPERGWWDAALDAILRHGPLARRLLRAVGPAPDRDRLRSIYRELADCLAENRLFAPTA